MDIKGHTVHKVLIAEAYDIAQEYYLSFLVDRAGRQFMSICSVEGGVEIEEVAHTKPEAVARIGIDPLTGVDRAKAEEIIDGRPLPPRRSTARSSSRPGSGPCSPTRTPRWSRSTRWR